MDLNFKKGIIKESLWKFFSSILGKSGALIFIVLLARFLKPEGFGIYNLAMSIGLIFITLTDVGINQALVRYVSYALGKQNSQKANAYLRYLLKIKSVLIGFFSIFLLILSYPLAFYIFKKPGLFIPLIVVTLYLIVISFESFFEYLFFAIKKTKLILAKEVIFQFLRIMFALAVFNLFISSYFVTGVLIGVVFTSIIVFIFVLLSLKKLTDFVFIKSSEEIEKKKVLKFLKYLTIGSLSTIFFGYIDIIMLGIFLHSSYVGYYSAAFTLMTSIALLLTFTLVALPVFTQLEGEQLKRFFNKVFKYSCILSIPAVFGAIALGRYIIQFVYGSDYLLATIPLLFLTPLIISIPITGLFVALFSAKEKPKYFVKMLLISAVMNIVLNFVLINYFLKISMEFAMVGAALATLTSRYFYLFSLGFLTNKKLGIKIDINSCIKPLISSLIMLIVLIKLNTYISDMTISLGILEIFLGIAIYLIAMILLKGVTKEDLKFLKT